MSQVYFIIFPSSTSSRAVLGEGVLQYDITVSVVSLMLDLDGIFHWTIDVILAIYNKTHFHILRLYVHSYFSNHYI